MNLNVLNNLSYGMYVVSTIFSDKKVGCFVNTVTQITAENPIISISINKNNYTNEALRNNKKFSVSILSEKTDANIIGRFGFFSSKDTDKFLDTKHEMIEDVPVVLENVCGYLICEVINIVDVETHDIFLARVINTKQENDNIPMTYSYYHNVIKGKAPKTAPTYIEESEIKKEVNKMAKYKCKICGYIYDESIEGVKFEDLPEDWTCPLCKVPKSMFEKVEE